MTESTSISAPLTRPPTGGAGFGWVRTWFAGGPAHGSSVPLQADGTFDIDGHRYRFFSGPYAQPGSDRESWQLFVSAELDTSAALGEVQRFLHERRS